MFDRGRLCADFSTHQLKLSFLLEHVSFKCINTTWRIKGKPLSMRKTCRAGLQSRFGQIRLLSRLSWYISHGGMVFTHRWPLLLWCYIVSLCFVAGPETSCGRKRRQRVKLWGRLFFSSSLSSLMLLLMKGLTAAVALLKQQLVVSDKVWKKRQWRNRGSEGQPACLIFLFAEEDSHRGRPPLWGDAEIIKSILFSVNLLPCLWFYARHQRDKTEVKKMFLWNIHGIFKKST